jgi:putative transcriptional regulator
MVLGPPSFVNNRHQLLLPLLEFRSGVVVRHSIPPKYHHTLSVLGVSRRFNTTIVPYACSDSDEEIDDGDIWVGDACPGSQPARVVGDWREFRAYLVAREERMELRKEFPQISTSAMQRKKLMMNLVRDSLGRHVRTKSKLGPEGGETPSSWWSHAISHPEKGCLLVAKQPSMGMFSYSVILMTEHDDRTGSSGLVLNMSTPLYVANLGLEEHISDALGQCPLYIGGPVSRNLLHVLHGCSDVEDSMEIVPGIYAGGVESATELVLAGHVERDEFRLLAGYSGWEPYQLAEEIRQGAWHVISASRDVILGCIKNSFGSDTAVDMTMNDKLECWKAIVSETTGL